MEKLAKIDRKKILIFSMLILGIFLVFLSIFYTIVFLAIAGSAMVCWGVIFLFITPAKYVPLTFLDAAAISATRNIERTLAEANLSNKGRYLPPNSMRDSESSIVVIPEKPGQPLPKPEYVVEEKLLPPNKDFLFITPPGLELSKLFEKELDLSFTKTDLNFVQQKLPKLLIEKMELAKRACMQIQSNIVVLELTGNLFRDVCQETRKLPRTHDQVGCLLGSAVACVLAKASGKIVTIQKDEQSDDGKTTRIEYRIEDE